MHTHTMGKNKPDKYKQNSNGKEAKPKGQKGPYNPTQHGGGGGGQHGGQFRSGTSASGHREKGGTKKLDKPRCPRAPPPPPGHAVLHALPRTEPAFAVLGRI